MADGGKRRGRKKIAEEDIDYIAPSTLASEGGSRHGELFPNKTKADIVESVRTMTFLTSAQLFNGRVERNGHHKYVTSLQPSPPTTQLQTGTGSTNRLAKLTH